MPESTELMSGTGISMSRRNLLVGGALACASGIAFANEPQVANPLVDSKKFASWIPEAFGEWRTTSHSGVVLPPEDALQDRLYDNLATRVYSADGLPAVMLLLAYNNAQSGVVQVHRPEVCYPVGGFLLSPTLDFALQGNGKNIPANFFTATSPNRVEQVAYFTRLGSSFPRSWAEQRLAVVRANLAGDIPDGMLMRVSILGPDQRSARSVLGDFAGEFITKSNPRLQRLLLGSAT